MKSFFVVEDHTVTNIGLQQLIAQKTGLSCIGFASSKTITGQQAALWQGCFGRFAARHEA